MYVLFSAVSSYIELINPHTISNKLPKRFRTRHKYPVAAGFMQSISEVDILGTKLSKKQTDISTILYFNTQLECFLPHITG